MKRIITVLAVAALMAVMLVAMAAPAFAKGQPPPCKGTAYQVQWPQGSPPDANMNGVACYNYKTGSYTDDRG